MPVAPRLALLLAALVLAPAARAAAPEPPEPVARMRFGWTPPLRARVTYRRTRLRPGAAPAVFTARYETRVEPAPDGLRITTRGTSWHGDLPFPRALEKDAIRASEAVVQRVEPEGRFAGLDGVEAMRPVLARLFEDAKVPPDAAARATPLAEAALRAEAEELWNLAVGFWSGADLRVGEAYALAREGEIPLLPGARAPQQVVFQVRRRVPCAAGERADRCVEATLRQTPDRAALERAAAPLVARLLPAGVARGEGAEAELSAEGELVLVTDPATLLPRRLVWTKAVRLGATDDRPARAELVDRTEYDWRWLPPEPPRTRGIRRRAPAAPPASAPPPLAGAARDAGARDRAAASPGAPSGPGGSAPAAPAADAAAPPPAR
ncbi:MAG TPA: hypothetical protein VF841_02095 [Anaeromyxobacter sp.]